MFERINLVLDKNNIDKIRSLNVLIVGIGGVGGYALECLVRCGVGNITIIDNDLINESNLNRQIIALNSTINNKKVEIAKNRMLDINPDLNIKIINEFILEENFNNFISKDYDYIIDACDTITTKILLMKFSSDFNIKLISCMGTGNRINPTELTITSLNKTYNDPLAKNIRRILKEKDLKINPMVIWSRELPIKNGSRTPGSMIMVPMTAGNYCAYYIINDILKDKDNL